MSNCSSRIDPTEIDERDQIEDMHLELERLQSNDNVTCNEENTATTYQEPSPVSTVPDEDLEYLLDMPFHFPLPGTLDEPSHRRRASAPARRRAATNGRQTFAHRNRQLDAIHIMRRIFSPPSVPRRAGARNDERMRRRMARVDNLRRQFANSMNRVLRRFPFTTTGLAGYLYRLRYSD
ncbi:uncharacterized protein LOC111518616 [Drosophila willistoni]|uniref:uncharacterized protein LOC111518616 n=1 Tax=Drosophila willistoni TaxID=7260 RepID=UPI000C26CD95|nr:uncharacterized protein LOC111518616 [Drosophila willistoni]